MPLNNTCSVRAWNPTKILQEVSAGVSRWKSQARPRPSPARPCGDDVQGRGGLVEREPGEKAELDQLGRRGHPRTDRRVSASSRSIRSSGGASSWTSPSKIEPLAARVAPLLEPLAGAGSVDQNPPHGLGRGGEEMAAAVPASGLLRHPTSRR